jgi:dimethylhistidine N-methyltransferase
VKTAAKRNITAIAPGTEEFRDDLLHGLRGMPKSVPCKYFYDETGARLFDEICTLPEYYPARVETALLRAHSGEIAALAGRGAEIMEFGAACGEKIRILLDALHHPLAYVPVDISENWLGTAVERLARDYPALRIYPVIGDFAAPLCWPTHSGGRRIGFFPGSTIGNFTPTDARQLLLRLAGILRGGALLIGVDLVKDPGRLHAAYNDAAGVTAAFNCNLLVRANRELDANFDLAAFSHYALYNAQEHRIEMHLISRKAQCVSISGHAVSFAEGETVITEYSYKYTTAGFQELAASAGLSTRKVWCDSERLFSIQWLDVV